MSDHGQTNVWLIAGLGNPGREYERTRHNIGFACIDAIQESLSARGSWKSGYGCLYTTCDLPAGHRVILAKPQTYMNRSGEPLSKLTSFYKIAAAHSIVVHDELDLPLGTLRIRLGGGLAGHNGLKSIQQHFGTSEFYRLRLGIGRPLLGGMDVAAWVLARFSSEENAVAVEMQRRGQAAIQELITKGLKSAQNLYNS